MKIGIYGGSFNPVHFGHVGLAKWVIENTDLDELWMLVSPNNPLKPAGMLAPEEERLEGVREAIKDIPHVKASDFEFHLPRPSYTANTLRSPFSTNGENMNISLRTSESLYIPERPPAKREEWPLPRRVLIFDGIKILRSVRRSRSRRFAILAKLRLSTFHQPIFAVRKDVRY